MQTYKVDILQICDKVIEDVDGHAVFVISGPDPGLRKMLRLKTALQSLGGYEICGMIVNVTKGKRGYITTLPFKEFQGTACVS